MGYLDVINQKEGYEMNLKEKSKFQFDLCKDKNNRIISDLFLITPTVFGDHRGYFMETHNEEFNRYIKHIDGSPALYVQDNESKSNKGVLRGLHFQLNNPQGKCVRVISGKVYDVVVDLRVNSETFGSWYGIELSSENKKQLLIPEGFAHGYLVLSDYAIFAYKCTRIYAPDDEVGLLWNSELVEGDKIIWPHIDCDIKLSVKDKSNKKFLDLVNSGKTFTKYLVNKL